MFWKRLICHSSSAHAALLHPRPFCGLLFNKRHIHLPASACCPGFSSHSSSPAWRRQTRTVSWWSSRQNETMPLWGPLSGLFWVKPLCQRRPWPKCSGAPSPCSWCRSWSGSLSGGLPPCSGAGLELLTSVCFLSWSLLSPPFINPPAPLLIPWAAGATPASMGLIVKRGQLKDKMVMPKSADFNSSSQHAIIPWLWIKICRHFIHRWVSTNNAVMLNLQQLHLVIIQFLL